MSYQIPSDPQITSMVLYYRALNMARKEPSLVAAYVKRVEKGAPIVKVLKPDLGMPWERHGYSIELRREIDAEQVRSSGYACKSWDKVIVSKRKGDPVCIANGEWYVTGRSVPARLMLKLLTPSDSMVYMLLFNGTNVDVEALRLTLL
jgi:hypothetical protein